MAETHSVPYIRLANQRKSRRAFIKSKNRSIDIIFWTSIVMVLMA